MQTKKTQQTKVIDKVTLAPDICIFVDKFSLSRHSLELVFQSWFQIFFFIEADHTGYKVNEDPTFTPFL